MRPKQKPTACSGCPAYDKGIGYCEPEQYTDTPELTVIFDGPDEMAARFSSPFFWKSLHGRTFKQWLREAGIERDEVQYTNVVRCWLPKERVGDLSKGQRAPTKEEAEYCMRAHLVPHLQKTGAYSDRSVIVCVGSAATRYVRGIKGSTEPHIGVVDRLTDPDRKDG